MGNAPDSREKILKRLKEDRALIKITKAKFSTKQTDLAIAGMAGLGELIRGFSFVKNSVGQAFQRYIHYPITAVIKVLGRKTAITITLPKMWCVAVDVQTAVRLKGKGSAFLNTLQAKHVSPVRAIQQASELLAYFGAKLMTSQDSKFEGGLMSLVVSHLESNSGVELVSLKIGDTEYTRGSIDVKRDNQQTYLQVLTDAGIAPQHSRKRERTYGEEIPML